MGVLRRAKEWVVGKVQRANEWIHSSIYADKLEVLKAKKWSNPKHREIRVENDPIINALVQRVANLITERTPIFLDKVGNEMEDLKEQWEKLSYNNLLNDVIQATRTHGYCVVEPLKDDVLEDRDWLVHDSTDIQKIKFKKLKIEKYKVKPELEEGENIEQSEAVSDYDLFPEDVIHFSVGKSKLNRQGVAPIKAVWDSSVRYNEIVSAMAEYDARIGNGMMILSLDPNEYSDQQSNLITAIKKTNTRSVLLLKSSTMTGQAPTITWEGSGNKVNWTADLEELMKIISGSSGFPVRWFIGDPKGAQSAAKEDRIAIWTTLKQIFQEYIPFIRKLLLKQEDGEALNESVKEIVFDDGGNLVDSEDYNKAVNEEKQELEPVEEPEEKDADYLKKEKNYVEKYD
ncbi:MAG: hypothetical protein ACFFCE_05740 [Promethearchaeota archaeon]